MSYGGAEGGLRRGRATYRARHRSPVFSLPELAQDLHKVSGIVPITLQGRLNGSGDALITQDSPLVWFRPGGRQGNPPGRISDKV